MTTTSQLSPIKFSSFNVILNQPMKGTLHLNPITFVFLKIIPDNAVQFSNNAVIYIYGKGIKTVTDTQLTQWEKHPTIS